MGDIISIIIPAYNIEAYIGKCIESIICQTYVNIEIIIVNDGSTDKTHEICKKFVEGDSRIVYISQENKGLVGARKTGLINSKGKYIVFVDGDDYIDRDLVERLYELMIEKDVDFIHSNYMIDGKNMNHVKKVHVYNENDLDIDFRIKLLKENVFEWDNKKEIFECNLYGCIYKKEFIVDCYMSLPNYQQYGEDLLCFCNQIMKCKSMMMIPEAYYHYVIRDGSLDHPKNFEDALADKISLYKEVKKLLEQYKVLAVLLKKCQQFFAIKMIHNVQSTISNNTYIEHQYKCDFINLLKERKVIIYGAGVVGQSIYKQLVKYQNIEIIAWVDQNYKDIYCEYRQIDNPLLIDSIEYDYIVVAIESQDIAQKIIEYLVDRNIKKSVILWEEYKKITQYQYNN